MPDFRSLVEQMQHLQEQQKTLEQRRNEIQELMGVHKDQVEAHKQQLIAHKQHLQGFCLQHIAIDEEIERLKSQQQECLAAVGNLNSSGENRAQALPAPATAVPRKRIEVIDLCDEDDEDEDISTDTQDFKTEQTPTAIAVPHERELADPLNPPTATARPAFISQFQIPSQPVRDDHGRIHKKYPTVLNVAGRWVEVICITCHNNAPFGSLYFRGLRGFASHFRSHHAKDWSFENRFYKERVVSEEDVRKMLVGEKPSVAVVRRGCTS